MNKYYFKDVARSERFFVSTLLCHCLMNNNYENLKELFIKLLGEQTCENLAKDYEVVTELDPLRDASVVNENVRELYREFKRIAVPDLFLRWDNKCLVIEAKFFSDPADDDVINQINSQKKAVKKLKNIHITVIWIFTL